MKPTLRALAIILPLLLVLPVALQAGPVTIPPADTSGPGPNDLNAFEAGKPAKAAEVMHNFRVLAEANNDLEARLAKLEAAITVLANGKVGIGTTTPSDRLEIKVAVDGASEALEGIRITGARGGTTTLAAGDSNAQGVSNYRHTFKISTNTAGHNAGGGELTAMHIFHDGWGETLTSSFPNGKVGIGTDAPDATLDVRGTVKVFGGYEAKQTEAVYQAATDGFVVVYAVIAPGGAIVGGLCDPSDPPSTVRAKIASDPTNFGIPFTLSFTMPVPKGHYWKVTGSNATVSWLPLGR